MELELLIIIAIAGAAAIYIFFSFARSINSKKSGGCNCSGCDKNSCNSFHKEE